MSNARNIASIAGEDVLNASNEIVPVYACRAWVKFQGTGTVQIFPNGYGNVSSITDNGTGDYTINFATAMPDANYSVVGAGGGSVGIPVVKAPKSGASFSTASVQFEMLNAVSSSTFDTALVCVAIFR